MAEFARDVQILTRQAYPEIDALAQDQLMKRIFLNGLTSSLRKFVILSDPATFDEAVTAARRQEAQEKFNYLRYSLPEKQPDEITAKLLTRINKLELALEETKTGTANRSPALQHKKRQPNTLQSYSQRSTRYGNPFQPANRSPSQPGPLRWNDQGAPLCWLCNRPGHRKAQCPNSKRGQVPLNQERRAMAVETTKQSSCTSDNGFQLEMKKLAEENETLRLQNERLMEQLYPKRAAAVFLCSTSRRKSNINFCLLLLLCGGLLVSASAYTFYLCVASSHGFAVAVPKEINCVPPAVGTVINVPAELWIPRTDPVKTTAVKCQVHVRIVCTNMGFFGSKGIVSDSKTLEAVPVSDCRS